MLLISHYPEIMGKAIIIPSHHCLYCENVNLRVNKFETRRTLILYNG